MYIAPPAAATTRAGGAGAPSSTPPDAPTAPRARGWAASKGRWSAASSNHSRGPHDEHRPADVWRVLASCSHRSVRPRVWAPGRRVCVPRRAQSRRGVCGLRAHEAAPRGRPRARDDASRALTPREACSFSRRLLAPMPQRPTLGHRPFWASRLARSRAARGAAWSTPCPFGRSPRGPQSAPGASVVRVWQPRVLYFAMRRRESLGRACVATPRRGAPSRSRAVTRREAYALLRVVSRQASRGRRVCAVCPAIVCE